MFWNRKKNTKQIDELIDRLDSNKVYCIYSSMYVLRSDCYEMTSSECKECENLAPYSEKFNKISK